ncbi:hypothetical protein JNUCC42_01670 [Brevibacterium sp. JNUCC-42]|uniref:Uncharacterized protein n=1 Tax=Brevibacillus laterosporus TaxID=1465 RepID=A0A502I511_BRELA|nr:hypothetical protein [Brevibacillus laterosporus]QOS99520.1 hypothetical protein JNUCC42_01670 [Brevibacterium sp. JNUCC-42]QDX95185.1 hypothetical protein EEL30_24555 [Brevibacillus laterosporus]RAP26828.1 hypothetical protein C2W64_01269 [Brevibacillus laterosporus]TPG69100.1 hypothetical protein EEL31_11540 [Brevibacillus laterosporus]TPG82007.1 hypothetical protein EEL32_19920 [Brevibacillus laterosporus]
MKITLHQISNKIGFREKELATAILNGDVTGEVPDQNPQSKLAWVDLLSLQNYMEWLYEQGNITEQKFLKGIRHIELIKQKMLK